MKQLLESVDEPNVGDADTMLIRYKDQLLEMFPKAKTAFIKFKQLEEKTHNYIRADYNRGWYKMMHGDLLGGFTLMNLGRDVSLWNNGLNTGFWLSPE